MKYKIKVLTSNLLSLVILEKKLHQESLNLKIVFLPTKRKRFVFLKSPHVNKKSKEHYEFLRHQRLYYVQFTTLSLLKTFLFTVPNDIMLTFKKLS